MNAGQVDMATPWTRFESPDEITFAIEIKNVSGKPIKLKDIRYGTGYAEETKNKLNSNHYAPHLFEFAFTDRDGQAIARSQREFTLDSHAMILSNALLTEVEPNQSLKLLLQPAKFERSMDYRLSAGDYKVQVHHRGPSPEVQKWIETHYVGREPENALQHQVTSNLAAFSIAADSHRQPELDWGAEKDGLQAALEIRAPMDSGIPTRDPGVAATKQLVPIVHVKNFSEKPITLTSETGRQGDQLQIKTKAGKDVDIKDAFFTGWPIDVRWTLQPGDVAELDVLTPSLHQDLPAGEYQSEILTGWCPLFFTRS